ncbi:hypothetical protein BH10PSE5_BH10PSE5_01800 [soil metagenome]
MSLAKFERFFDRIAPAILLVMGLTVAAATAVVGV